MKAEIKDGDFPVDKVKYPHHYIIAPGGDPSNPSWKEYLDNFKKEWQPHIVAIKDVLEREGLIGSSGESFDNRYFELDDEYQTKIAFSWRAHGDLMQAIVDKREGYITYYM